MKSSSKKVLSRQLLIQRFSFYGYAVCAILLIVYSLGFLTNEYLFYAYGDEALIEFYHGLQWLNREFLWKAIVIVIFASLLGVLQIRDYAAGRITFLITLVFAAVSIVFSFICINDLLHIKYDYFMLDMTYLDRYIDRGTISYNVSAFVFDLGAALWAMTLITSLLLSGIVFFNAHKAPNKKEETAAV